MFQTNTMDLPYDADHVLSETKKIAEAKGIFFWSNGIMTQKPMTSPSKNMQSYEQETKKKDPKEKNTGSGDLTHLEQTHAHLLLPLTRIAKLSLPPHFCSW